ncbi:MAG: cytidylate kinase-like family protein [Clostridia bacterium]|nr:cytidylate kinase-like family protein [Clostridia bacterium]
MNKIITIGREFGSGGRELGRKIAEKLGWEFYDKEIITEIAKRTEFSEHYIHEVLENNPHELFPITVGHTFTFVDTYALQRKQVVFSEQENTIKQMAENSNCVIVGRCSDYILRESSPVKVFVYSDMQSKVNRCREREEVDHLSDKKLIKTIKKIDKNRARYYEFYTGHRWGDKLNYDLMVNTSKGDLDAIAESICKLLK